MTKGEIERLLQASGCMNTLTVFVELPNGARVGVDSIEYVRDIDRDISALVIRPYRTEATT